MARKAGGDGSLDRAAWVSAARDAMKAGGVPAVRIEVLARRLNATPGSFYWHFKKRDDLLDALLADWEIANMQAFEAALRSDLSAELRLTDMALSWIGGDQFSPAYDSAVRDWARTSVKVARVLRKIDDRRMEILAQILRAYGFGPDQAFIRARVLYFHQVGYYALNMTESRNTRLDLLAKYSEVLLGKALSAGAEAHLTSQQRPARRTRSAKPPG